MNVELGGTNVFDPTFRYIRSSYNVAEMGMKDRLLDLEPGGVRASDEP